jgi:aspartate racemase
MNKAAPTAHDTTDRVIGILGGMGPLVTADFMREIILATPAQGDADHIPIVLSSNPRIPDRIVPIMKGGGATPLPAICAQRDLLIDAGAQCIAMPCNTAHHWYDELALDCRVPFISIVDAVLGELKTNTPPPARIGLIATAATLHSGFYQRRLADEGYDCRVPDGSAMESQVLPAIALVKKNRLAEAERLFRPAIEGLLASNARVAVLACTEVPAAFRGDQTWMERHCLDSTAALARACVAWALGR